MFFEADYASGQEGVRRLGSFRKEWGVLLPEKEGLFTSAEAPPKDSDRALVAVEMRGELSIDPALIQPRPGGMRPEGFGERGRMQLDCAFASRRRESSMHGLKDVLLRSLAAQSSGDRQL
jgi:hypothetical protein